jgi:mannosyltransferase
VKVVGRKITKYGIALLAIVLVGAFLRLYHLRAQSLGADDTWSVWIALLSVPKILQSTAADVHPPLYYFLLHYWMAYFGASELAVKLPSVVFGVLSIIVMYALGRQLFDDRTGLLGAFILAVSAFNIRYSQETRMYSLLVLLGLLSMYFFIRLFQRSTPLTWAGYVISTTLLLYTHVYGLFLLIAQNLYVISLLAVSRKDAFWWRRWAVLQLVVIVLFAPWVQVLINKTSGATSSGGASSFLALPGASTAVVDTLTSYVGGTLLLAIFLVLSLLSLVTYGTADGSISSTAPLQTLRRYVRGMRITHVYSQYFLIVWFLSALLLPVALSLFSTVRFDDRYTITASVALYLLAAKGIVNIKPRGLQLAVVIVIVVLSVVNAQSYVNNQSTEQWAKEAWVQSRETFSIINQQGRSGDLVILYPQFLWSVNRYYDKVQGINASLLSGSNTTIQANINNLQNASKNDRVWFVVYSYDAPPNTVEKSTISTFNETHTITSLTSFGGYRVYLLEKRV